jgi:FlaA1/EpsC-like NDP-sugar epimerase
MLKKLSKVWDNSRFIKRVKARLPYRLPFSILFHLVLFALAYLGSFYLRFEGLIPNSYYQTMLKTLPAVLLSQGFFFYYHDLYRSMWGYVCFADLTNILRATMMSLMALLFLEILLARFTGNIPWSIYVLDGLLVVTLTGGCRFLVRHLRERVIALSDSTNVRRVILVGPPEAAEPLLREMLTHDMDYLPVALACLDESLQGTRIYDVPVIGGASRIPEMAEHYRVNEIIFVWPDAPQDELNEIIEECKRFQVRFKIVPPLSAVLNGHYRLADVRDIELEDLLPRPPIYMDKENLNSLIEGQVVAITGAGGSIGSELCRQIAKFGPKSLVLIERAENTLVDIETELRRRFPDLDLQALVGSINNAPGMRFLFERYQPNLVFHAAAHKHVPLMESSPLEAAYNNILGTRNLAKAAITAKAERFVMISTDKAVNPTSVMGVSKRICEKYVKACNNLNHTKFITTRFGNVLGSAGSVIPLFKQQLTQGGPLTVTHPDIERFFMTIPEAVQLVLQAACMGQGGDIFVLNMGRPVRIRELAEKLIVLAGKTPNKDIAIVYTGLRPGEKLFEELFNVDEEPQPTEHPLINSAMGSKETWETWESLLDEIENIVKKQDVPGLVAKFKQIISNYVPYALDDKGKLLGLVTKKL